MAILMDEYVVDNLTAPHHKSDCNQPGSQSKTISILTCYDIMVMGFIIIEIQARNFFEK